MASNYNTKKSQTRAYDTTSSLLVDRHFGR